MADVSNIGIHIDKNDKPTTGMYRSHDRWINVDGKNVSVFLPRDPDEAVAYLDQLSACIADLRDDAEERRNLKKGE